MSFKIVFIIGIWLGWLMIFKGDEVVEWYYSTKFYFNVGCAVICYLTFNQCSSITQSKANGEIIRQICIGD